MPLIFGTIGSVTQSQQRQAAETVYALWVLGNDDPAFQDALGTELAHVDLTGPRRGLAEGGVPGRVPARRSERW